jgi:hypothetical protein
LSALVPNSTPTEGATAGIDRCETQKTRRKKKEKKKKKKEKKKDKKTTCFQF